MTDAYRTAADAGTAMIEVHNSRFEGRVRPVTDRADAEAFIDAVTARHPDATHHVPAYRVRIESGDSDGGVRVREYQDDAGEPSGSAGPPVLNVLQGQALQNVVVVVTRYFGGTELGVGGLVSAYTEAVTAAIDAAGTTTRHPQTEVVIEVEYDDSGTVRSILASENLSFEATYEAVVSFTVTVPDHALDSVLDRVRSGTSGRATIES